MMRWVLWVMLGLVLLAAGGFVADQVLWTLRGSPARQVDVHVVTAMELKGHKEDYGTAETAVTRCGVMLTPSPSAGPWLPPCWWLERHREVLRRY